MFDISHIIYVFASLIEQPVLLPVENAFRKKKKIEKWASQLLLSLSQVIFPGP